MVFFSAAGKARVLISLRKLWRPADDTWTRREDAVNFITHKTSGGI